MGVKMPDSGGITNASTDSHVSTSEKTKNKPPKLFIVLLHNDNYTTMEFVVEVLRMVFKKSEEESTRIMLNVHKKGIGKVDAYPYDIAISKVNQVHSLAKERQFPLKCSCEPI